jgi:hypothetical protein
MDHSEAMCTTVAFDCRLSDMLSVLRVTPSPLCWERMRACPGGVMAAFVGSTALDCARHSVGIELSGSAGSSWI